jgi:hypothetical protein
VAVRRWSVHIEIWPIDRPRDYPKNARKWSAQAVEKVAASLREYDDVCFNFAQSLEDLTEGLLLPFELRNNRCDPRRHKIQFSVPLLSGRPDC